MSLDDLSRNLANGTVSRRRALAVLGASVAAAAFPFARAAEAGGAGSSCDSQDDCTKDCYCDKYTKKCKKKKFCKKTHCNPKAQGNNCGQKDCFCKQVKWSGPWGFRGKCVSKN